MQSAEIPSLINHIFLRLDKLENTVDTLSAKEKDLHTIVIDGFAHVGGMFARMDKQFADVYKRFDEHETQIDLLAIELQTFQSAVWKRFDKVDARMDKMDGKIDKIDGKLTMIMEALRVR